MINNKGNDQKSTMARNLEHARADDIANENKNVSHNTLNYRELTTSTADRRHHGKMCFLSTNAVEGDNSHDCQVKC